MIRSSPSCSQCGIRTIHSIRRELVIFGIPRQKCPPKTVVLDKPVVEISETSTEITPTPGNIICIFYNFMLQSEIERIGVSEAKNWIPIYI